MSKLDELVNVKQSPHHTYVLKTKVDKLLHWKFRVDSFFKSQDVTIGHPDYYKERKITKVHEVYKFFLSIPLILLMWSGCLYCLPQMFLLKKLLTFLNNKLDLRANTGYATTLILTLICIYCPISLFVFIFFTAFAQHLIVNHQICLAILVVTVNFCWTTAQIINLGDFFKMIENVSPRKISKKSPSFIIKKVSLMWSKVKEYFNADV